MSGFILIQNYGGDDDSMIQEQDRSETSFEDNSNTIYKEAFNEIEITIPEVSSLFATPIVYGKEHVLYKRQLSDVKVQLAMEDDMVAEPDMDVDTSLESSETPAFHVNSALSIASGNLDVIKGSYEGGFKTWECSIDLLEYLASSVPPHFLHNIKALELGCGSAIPSIHILKTSPSSTIHLQDYNSQVLKYVTIPNILLNSGFSPNLDSQNYISTSADIELDLDEIRGNALDLFKDIPQNSTENIANSDQKPSGYFELSDNQISQANKIILQKLYPETNTHSPNLVNNHRVRLFSGSWNNFLENIVPNTPPSQITNDSKYDLILTSETIYDLDSQTSLYNCIANLLKKPISSQNQQTDNHVPTAYVAAKSMYFGLSGSILSFTNLVKSKNQFNIESVWKSGSGVQREILKLTWI
ncbi:hypothetical protein BB559_006629 [Furculomyces boomerangus]|uniref:protein-histidine N-methyltransferase n=1 Tax=Furculomyces boomerangus TaxID=61424 RepID=A0A2T9Y1F7_9FUNG|nr:hypothetical protein BB559_006629 [Furculomyces boomerangus]